MTNMNGLPICCQARRPTPVGRLRITDCLWRPYYGSRAPAAHGAICHPILDRGIACTNALPDGLGQRYGTQYSLNWRATPTSKKSSLTVRLCVPTSMPPEQRKKRRPGNRTLAWWLEHQDSRSGRWSGHARSLSSDGRTSWRQSRSAAFARRAETRQPGCRQSLRFERDPATLGIGRYSSRHSQPRKSPRATSFG
jgi:hypothetical protein